MAAVEITISGMLYDKLNRTTQNVVLIGEATLTGLGVGGGPIIPPTKPPLPPLGIWPGPGDPDYPGRPPTIWPGPGDPDYPIRPPVEPPTGPADDNGFIKPPPADGGWAYHEDYGWMYSPGPKGAGPKTTTAAPPPKK